MLLEDGAIGAPLEVILKTKLLLGKVIWKELEE